MTRIEPWATAPQQVSSSDGLRGGGKVRLVCITKRFLLEKRDVIQKIITSWRDQLDLILFILT